MQKNVSFILTTLNEGSYLEECLNEIEKIINPKEIIIIDDGSTDNTIKILEKLKDDRYKIISRINTKGFASAISRGIIESNQKIICWMDTGMYYLLDRYLEMINEIEKNHYEFGILSRYIENGADERSTLRAYSSKIFNKFCQNILTSKITDYSSGLFAMKRSVLNTSLPDNDGYGEFIVKYIYLLHTKKIKIKEKFYVHKNLNEENSNTNQNLLSFFILGIKYVLKIIIFRIFINSKK